VNEPIAVFAYDFPHRKTNEFLKQLKFMGLNDVLVLAAPKIKLNVSKTDELYEGFDSKAYSENTKEICTRLNYKYVSIPHDSAVEIQELTNQHKTNFAIIAGARILKKEIIQLFPEGVLNFHPGKIPQTSGLDSLYYTFMKGAEAGVTVHLIDEKVDAGRQWCFEPIELQAFDNLSTITEKIFQLQIGLLGKFLNETSPGNIMVHPVIRESKNLPMNLEEKVAAYLGFDRWLVTQISKQKDENVYKACASDDLNRLRKYLKPHEVNLPIECGWTPLIVSAFHHSKTTLIWLLENGANVNQSNAKGTTPLMYAKTKYLNNASNKYEILDLLLGSGAVIAQKDIFGKTIIDYCQEANDSALVNFLTKTNLQ